MLRDSTTVVTGWFFLAGALRLWGGALRLWGGAVLRPRRVGVFFRSGDCPASGTRLPSWSWLCRMHPFDVGVRTLVALAALLALCPRALALNPALDVSQYGHTSWK